MASLVPLLYEQLPSLYMRSFRNALEGSTAPQSRCDDSENCLSCCSPSVSSSLLTKSRSTQPTLTIDSTHS